MPLAPPGRLLRAVFLLILILALTACGRTNTPMLPSQTAAGAPTTPPEDASPVPAPSATAAPLPLRVALWAGAQPDPGVVSAVEDLAGGSGYETLRLEVLDAAALESALEDARLPFAIIAPQSPQESETLTQLVVAFPDIHFIALGAGDIDPVENLSLIGGSPAEEAFLAGYAAAIITPEWRVGILNRADTPGGLAARDAFLNGTRYLCGVCMPRYPPYVAYPAAADIQGGGDWQAGLQALMDQGVTTVYLSPELDDAQVQAAAAGAGLLFITAKGVSGDAAGTAEKWVATLSGDPLEALREAWPAFMEGQAGEPLSLPVEVLDANPAFLTDARLRLVREIAQALADGSIYPGTVPTEDDSVGE
jgi:hypothetical protein